MTTFATRGPNCNAQPSTYRTKADKTLFAIVPSHILNCVVEIVCDKQFDRLSKIQPTIRQSRPPLGFVPRQFHGQATLQYM
jgi:hypothetical protein